MAGHDAALLVVEAHFAGVRAPGPRRRGTRAPPAARYTGAPSPTRAADIQSEGSVRCCARVIPGPPCGCTASAPALHGHYFARLSWRYLVCLQYGRGSRARGPYLKRAMQSWQLDLSRALQCATRGALVNVSAVLPMKRLVVASEGLRPARRAARPPTGRRDGPITTRSRLTSSRAPTCFYSCYASTSRSLRWTRTTTR